MYWLSSYPNRLLLKGRKHETLSSRAYREQLFIERWINRLFFLQKEHCLHSYLNYKERKTKMEEQLELPMAQLVSCQSCGKKTHFPLMTVKHTGRSTEQMAFCGEQCATDFYLTRLRREGI